MIRAAADRTDTSDERSPLVQLRQLLLRSEDAAAVCGVSRRTWSRWNAAGEVPAAVSIAGVKRWPHAELAAWIEARCPPCERWSEMKNAAGATNPLRRVLNSHAHISKSPRPAAASAR